MNKKAKKVLIIVSAAVIILGGAALAGMYYMGDRIIDEAINEELDQELNQVASDNGQAGQTDESANAVAGNSSDKPAITPTESGQQADASNTKSTDKASSNKASGSAVNTTGNNTTEKNSEVIDKAKINEIKDKVTAEDKVSAAALIIKKLSANDINELKSMLPGGLNSAEKEKAKRLAYSRFTKEEISEIKQMYEKYMN